MILIKTSNSIGFVILVTAPVTSVCFSGDGNCILVGTLDSTVRLVDRDSGNLLSSYSGHVNTKYKLDSRLSNTDAYVVSGSEDGTIHFWELVQVSSFFFFFFIVIADTSVSLFLLQAKSAKVIKAHEKAVTTLAFHSKEALMISGSIDGKIKIWKSR